jgi:tRNA modification GTPase
MISDDTIVAISSAVGPAARMIVRLSGAAAFLIASKFVPETAGLPPATATRTRLNVNGLIFPAMLYCFRAPHSATGEDGVEIHLPGNPLLSRMLLDAAIAAGARSAEPGEFTSRAYFNRRLDLAAAEGVAAVIASQSERELDAARRLLSGELSRRLGPTMDFLAETLALVEAGIDFAGEEITVLDTRQTLGRISRIDSDLSTLLSESARFEKVSHEPRIVLVGRPNAGKSTLLNMLAGADRAIVSPQAGTTRDALSTPAMLRRGRVTLVDVAGSDDVAAADELTQKMAAAAARAAEMADVIVLVREVGDSRPDIPLLVQPHLRVTSKADLGKPPAADLAVSAHTGLGLQALRDRMDEVAFGAASPAASLALTARHMQCVEDARAALGRAGAAEEPELIALELREAMDALGGILGTVTPDDVLGRIFSKFCIGK